MFGSSVYSKTRPATAKLSRRDLMHQAADSTLRASAWSSTGSFDRNILARTEAIAQTVSRVVLPEGCNCPFPVSVAIRHSEHHLLTLLQITNSWHLFAIIW